jgi:hypothetical protein
MALGAPQVDALDHVVSTGNERDVVRLDERPSRRAAVEAPLTIAGRDPSTTTKARTAFDRSPLVPLAVAGADGGARTAGLAADERRAHEPTVAPRAVWSRSGVPGTPR